MLSRLKQLIEDRALLLAPQNLPFKLASGGTTPYYINMRNILLHSGMACQLVGEALANIMPEQTRAIGGVPTAGLLMMGPLLMQRADLTGFYIRSEPKLYGLQKQIEGGILPLNNALLEDTVTTGQSIMKCAEIARQAGYQIEHALALVDREQGARELLASHNIELRSVFKISDFNLN